MTDWSVSITLVFSHETEDPEKALDAFREQLADVPDGFELRDGNGIVLRKNSVFFEAIERER